MSAGIPVAVETECLLAAARAMACECESESGGDEQGWHTATQRENTIEYTHCTVQYTQPDTLSRALYIYTRGIGFCY